MRLLTVFFLALLAGCAALPERAPVENPQAEWRMRQIALARVTAWDLRGRIGVRTPEESGQASLQWQRDGERHRIELAGPLGSGRVRLTLDKHGAELRDSKENVYRDVSAQQLLRRTTGWQLPIEYLNYWVLGLPAPGPVAASELDEWGRLKTLTQQGWDIRFVDYAAAGVHELPARMFIQRRVDNAVALDVRLVVEQWNLTDVSGDAK